jgi:hypothetical protein
MLPEGQQATREVDVMGRLLRRLRGLAGVGATWGALWGTIGAGIGFVLGALDPFLWQVANPVVDWALGMAAYGFVSGIGFGTLLSLGEGSKLLRELSLKRVALWGILGSAAVPLLFLPFFEAGTTVFDILGAMGVTAMLGGTFAPGAVAIARRAELESGAEPDLLGDGKV